MLMAFFSDWGASVAPLNLFLWINFAVQLEFNTDTVKKINRKVF